MIVCLHQGEEGPPSLEYIKAKDLFPQKELVKEDECLQVSWPAHLWGFSHKCAGPESARFSQFSIRWQHLLGCVIDASSASLPVGLQGPKMWRPATDWSGRDVTGWDKRATFTTRQQRLWISIAKWQLDAHQHPCYQEALGMSAYASEEARKQICPCL